MNKLLSPALVFLTFFASSISFGQDCFDEIKDLAVDIYYFDIDEVALNEYEDNITCFLSKGVDSIDIELLSNGPILGLILRENGISIDDKITYLSIYNAFMSFKRSDEYAPMMRLSQVNKELENLPADYQKWNRISNLFEELGLDSLYISSFGEYLKENSNPEITLKELSLELQSRNQQTSVSLTPAPGMVNDQELFDQLIDYSNAQAINVESLIKQSMAEKKPILLYFTGHACVNCRKIEESVLKEHMILSELSEKFLFVPVYVDDRTALPEEKTVYVRSLDVEKTAKTVGQFNAYFQINEFETASQPYFVALNEKGEIFGTADYFNHKDSRDFQKFLDNALQDYNGH